MDSLVPHRLRTGLLEDGENEGLDESIQTTFALLRAFQKDAIVVAGRYAVAQRRRVVSAEDMRRALKYCARTFFERDDKTLAETVERERCEMEEEGEEEGEEEAGEEGEEEGEDLVASESDVTLARHVDTIVATWEQWSPTDHVHRQMKHAIDRVPIDDV